MLFDCFLSNEATSRLLEYSTLVLRELLSHTGLFGTKAVHRARTKSTPPRPSFPADNGAAPLEQLGTSYVIGLRSA